VYSRLLGAVEVGVKFNDLVALPFDELFVNCYSAATTMVGAAITTAPLAEMSQGAARSRRGAALQHRSSCVLVGFLPARKALAYGWVGSRAAGVHEQGKCLRDDDKKRDPL
jgi:hypothetical protein